MSSTSPLLVACLCARWCRTCDAYQATLASVRDTLSTAHPDTPLRFVWVDIEDDSDLIGDLDIDDFPTLLIARDDAVLFFGAVMPHAPTAERLLRSVIEHPRAPSAPPSAEVLALPRLLRDHPPL